MSFKSKVIRLALANSLEIRVIVYCRNETVIFSARFVNNISKNYSVKYLMSNQMFIFYDFRIRNVYNLQSLKKGTNTFCMLTF